MTSGKDIKWFKCNIAKNVDGMSQEESERFREESPELERFRGKYPKIEKFLDRTLGTDLDSTQSSSSILQVKRPAFDLHLYLTCGSDVCERDL